MNSTEPRKLADVIRQLRKAEEKLLFVQETALLLQEPVLAYLSQLHECMMDAYSDHLDAIGLFPEDATEQQEEEYDRFEDLFREAKVVMAKKVTAARRSSVPPSNAANQLAAEAWLKQQLETWESLKVDIPKSSDEVEETRNQNLELQEVSVAETPSEFGTDSSRTQTVNEPNSGDSLPREISDSIDVASRRPHKRSAEPETSADPVDHLPSTESRKDVAASARWDQLEPATNPCLGHAEGGPKMKPGPVPARTPAISDQPRQSRVHSNSGYSVKAIEEHDPLLPSMVKAPDKRSYPCSCRFHPEYGARPRTVSSGQPGHSQLPRECRRPTVPPDKTAPSKANEDQLPDMPEDLLSYLNRGEYVRFHRSESPPKRAP